MKNPGFLKSIFLNRCPRCRKGDLFTVHNPYQLKNIYTMHAHCPVCGQPTELFPDFWFVANYISYAFCAITTIISFFLYWLIAGITWRDNSIFHWMIFNAVLLVILIPPYLRLARTIYLSYYVKYDPQATSSSGK